MTMILTMPSHLRLSVEDDLVVEDVGVSGSSETAFRRKDDGVEA